MEDWRAYDLARLDAEYDASRTVPSIAPFVESYVARSAAMRATYAHERDVPYGDEPRERLDLFPARHAESPLVLFVHGGYWRRFSKDEFTFVVEPFVRRGAAAAVISYPLAPEATLDAIVASVRRAVLWLHANGARTHAAPGRIVATGHSAGGHLVAMMAATGWQTYGIPRDGSVPGDAPLRGIVPISGLFDLEPVRRSHVNGWLHADDGVVARNSPIRSCDPALRMTAAVGAAETSEFRRQTHAYADAWAAAGGRAHVIECAARNHFDVLDDLARDDGPIARAVFDML